MSRRASETQETREPHVTHHRPHHHMEKTNIVLTVIIVIAVVLFIIFMLVWLFSGSNPTKCKTDADCPGDKICDSKGICKEPPSPTPITCTEEPPTPNNVSVIYDALASTATLNWDSSPGATSYNVYRKFDDPSVGKFNYEEKDNVTVTTATFSGLIVGAHYFVVTALNNCGESEASHPPVIAASCNSFPATPNPPNVFELNDNCSATNSAQRADIIGVSWSDPGNPNGGYIIQGTGQLGSVQQYYANVSSGSTSFDGIFLKCSGQQTNHVITVIQNWTSAELNMPSVPSMSGNTFTMQWYTVPGAEAYSAWVVLFDEVNGIAYFYGGQTPGTNSSLVIPCQAGLTPVYGNVFGYKLCDVSMTSSMTTYTTATV